MGPQRFMEENTRLEGHFAPRGTRFPKPEILTLSPCPDLRFTKCGELRDNEGLVRTAKDIW